MPTCTLSYELAANMPRWATTLPAGTGLYLHPWFTGTTNSKAFKTLN